MNNPPIIYEEKNFLVVDKPAGLVVHSGAGVHEKTLSDWLTDKYPMTKKYSWPDSQRIGIVHRLDKDTSGLIILAKNPDALEKLQGLIRDHKINKRYLTLVLGKLEKGEGEIVGDISRDPSSRQQQKVTLLHFDWQKGKSRTARTEYKTINEYELEIKHQKFPVTFLDVSLDTGRMHQIRVHFKSIGHPVIGDQTYNTKHSRLVSKFLGLDRQFLHAYRLEFLNPFSKKAVDLKINLPEDLRKIQKKLTPIAW